MFINMGEGEITVSRSFRAWFRGSPETPANGKNCNLLDLDAPATQGKYTHFLGSTRQEKRWLLATLNFSPTT